MVPAKAKDLVSEAFTLRAEVRPPARTYAIKSAWAPKSTSCFAPARPACLPDFVGVRLSYSIRTVNENDPAILPDLGSMYL